MDLTLKHLLLPMDLTFKRLKHLFPIVLTSLTFYIPKRAIALDFNLQKHKQLTSLMALTFKTLTLPWF